jgi:hypothetical protein
MIAWYLAAATSAATMSLMKSLGAGGALGSGLGVLMSVINANGKVPNRGAR